MKTIVDGAIQIPIMGPVFQIINLCTFHSLKQICLNLQMNDDVTNDQPYFLTLDNARDLRNELVDAIKILEAGVKNEQ